MLIETWIRNLTIKIPIVFYSLRGYDFRFIMQEICKFKDIEMYVKASYTEIYMSFILSNRIY